MISQNCKNINASILTELSGTPKSFFSEETNRRIEKITTGKHTQQKERKRRREKKKHIDLAISGVLQTVSLVERSKKGLQLMKPNVVALIIRTDFIYRLGLVT